MYTFCDSNLARACRFLVCGAVIENLSNLDLPLTVIKDDAYKIIQGYFCTLGYYYAGKADLSKDYWNPKRKLGNHALCFVVLAQIHWSAMSCM